MRLHFATRHFAPLFISLVLVTGGFFLLAGCKSSEVDLQESRHQIVMVLQIADYDFGQSVSIVESTDENGKPCLVGVLSDELDAALEGLVNDYNADPSTDKKVTIEEIRYCLTEGIVSATSKENSNSPFWGFLYWTDDPAVLVYSMDVTTSSGMSSVIGDPVVGTNLSNYDFSTGREGNPFYTFAWE